MVKTRLEQTGFTIVELLVVIVVIGILAAITIVSYSGISQKASVTTIKSDLNIASKQLSVDSINDGVYPSSEETANGGIGLSKSPGTIYSYTQTSDGGYCLSATSTAAGETYHVSSSVGGLESGACPIQGVPIVAGNAYTCAISTTSQAYCWGYDNNGQLGIGVSNYDPHPLPGAVVTSGVLSGKTIKSIAIDRSHSCAIASDDNAYCWGNNGLGQLGNNTSGGWISSPVAVYTGGALSGKTILSIATASYSTCALASDNQVYCWGDSVSGQLGNGVIDSNPHPAAAPIDMTGVLSGKTIKTLSGNSNQYCVIASDNLEYCWGHNQFGNLGNNSTVNSSVPVAVYTSGVLSGKTIKAISVGEYPNCAIASDDQVYCWGYNSHGELGNDSTINSSVPVAVDTDGVLAGKTVKKIATGDNVVCAVASDNLAYCWGYNGFGSLGNNSNVDSHVPVAVSTSGALSAKTIQSISSGDRHVCVMASDDLDYCWGYNSYGQLGVNSTTDSWVPVAVQSLP